MLKTEFLTFNGGYLKKCYNDLEKFLEILILKAIFNYQFIKDYDK